MTEQAGLRERKRQRTHDTISAAAIALFLERGFDAVPVADVAAAAEVSKPTLFKYFPTKEDLVLHRIADHSGESARVVAGRAAGERPLAALRRHFLDGLRDRDPVTGLNDHPQVLAYHRMVFETPSLAARVASYTEADEAALAGALDPRGGLTARLAAGQVLVVQRILARDNWHRLIGGRTAAQVYRPAVTAANRAFDQLGSGLAGSW
ncbi:TetR family transcriptional regulator [Asanoa ferruginea]|uniref:TetR family transcriptional regulator n=1 Tax=Asanoa ferruginea TaxID=53367 RepID=A0A3D9ZLV8_9ACTN|nr:TetR family transcriptional regulator [Asanoa ferruginea]REF98197.1 TetR family transcriptional regulator [Asanoa ferruginea]GIF50833.1 TetR family transcriptional regulator [Asanoa ferruginea]